MRQARMLRGISALICIIFMAFASLVNAKVASLARQQQVLKNGWFIKQLQGQPHDIAALTEAAQKPDNTWLRTDMPNQVADVLLRFGRIPDPHVGKNAAACAWIWEQDWAYATTFVTPAGEGPVWLRLMGVDTIAMVYVNGQEVGRCNNMFRRYAFDIRSALKDNAENVLLLVFTGPAKELRRIEREVKLKHGIAATKYMRKSQCDFNNYLGARPNFMKVGLFREVILDVPADTWLEDTAIRPTLSDDLQRADVQVILDARGSNARVQYTLTDANGKTVTQGQENTQDPQFSFSVNQPRLWWPHTHGEPYLYTLTLEVLQGTTLLDA